MISVGREARANANGLAKISVLYQKGGRLVPTYNHLPQPRVVNNKYNKNKVLEKSNSLTRRLTKTKKPAIFKTTLLANAC